MAQTPQQTLAQTIGIAVFGRMAHKAALAVGTRGLHHGVVCADWIVGGLLGVCCWVGHGENKQHDHRCQAAKAEQEQVLWVFECVSQVCQSSGIWG